MVLLEHLPRTAWSGFRLEWFLHSQTLKRDHSGRKPHGLSDAFASSLPSHDALSARCAPTWAPHSLRSRDSNGSFLHQTSDLGPVRHRETPWDPSTHSAANRNLGRNRKPHLFQKKKEKEPTRTTHSNSTPNSYYVTMKRAASSHDSEQLRCLCMIAWAALTSLRALPPTREQSARSLLLADPGFCVCETAVPI